MIDQFTKQDLSNLAQKQNDPCVTIYLATEKTGREIYKPATQLKQLIKQAKQKLADNWMSEDDAAKFLKPIMKMAEDKEFWQDIELGLALFLNAGGLQTWRVEEKFADQVFVSRQFFLRPIVSTAGSLEPFYILSLSQNKAELFEADQTTICKVEVPNMPASAEAALNLTSTERGSSLHTGARQHQGKQSGVYHGHGGKSDVAQEDAAYFYRQVDQAINTYLGHKDQPLVLAAVANQGTQYRGVSSCSNLIEKNVTGGTDKLSQPQLLAHALPVVKEYFGVARQTAIESYRCNANTTKTLSEASEIVAASHVGKIDKLFVKKNASLPGEFNSTDCTIDYEASTADCDKDLVEEAIAQTLLHRGEVFAFSEDDMPDDQPMVATLRY